MNFEGINRIFGYGSLCWKPPCDEKFISSRETCYVTDLKNDFIIIRVTKGTPESPGLVVTLLGKDHRITQASTITKENQVFGMCFNIKKSYLDNFFPNWITERDTDTHERSLRRTIPRQTRVKVSYCIFGTTR